MVELNIFSSGKQGKKTQTFVSEILETNTEVLNNLQVPHITLQTENNGQALRHEEYNYKWSVHATVFFTIDDVSVRQGEC